jgi:U3 small nucleolar RNA-associated protein 21
VSCLEPAPVLDVMAVGHADGCVVLVDLKQDVAVMRLQHDDGAVSGFYFSMLP